MWNQDLNKFNELTKVKLGKREGTLVYDNMILMLGQEKFEAEIGRDEKYYRIGSDIEVETKLYTGSAINPSLTEGELNYLKSIGKPAGLEEVLKSINAELESE